MKYLKNKEIVIYLVKMELVNIQMIVIIEIKQLNIMLITYLKCINHQPLKSIIIHINHILKYKNKILLMDITI